jgi:hypothetical protein
VYTVTGGDRLHYCYSRPRSGGPRPRGGGATGQAVVVPFIGHQPTPLSRPLGGHRPRGGGATQAAPRARFCLLFFTNFFTFVNVLTPPSDHHLVHVC